jgi:outer membrane protein
MKRVLIFFTFICSVASLSFAQTGQGRFMLSGSSDMSVFFGNTKERYDGKKRDSYSNSQFNISPRASYFVVDNLAVGALFGVSYSDNDDNESTSFIIGPVARYYFQGEKVRPFAEALVGIGTNKWGSSKYSQFDFQLNGGIAYFFNDHVALDASVGYHHTGLTNRDDTNLKIKSNNFGLQIGFSILF